MDSCTAAGQLCTFRTRQIVLRKLASGQDELQRTSLAGMFAVAEGFAVADRLSSPTVDYDAMSWCPRCLSQHTHATGVCIDRQDIDLQSFECPVPKTASALNSNQSTEDATR